MRHQAKRGWLYVGGCTLPRLPCQATKLTLRSTLSCLYISPIQYQSPYNTCHLVVPIVAAPPPICVGLASFFSLRGFSWLREGRGTSVNHGATQQSSHRQRPGEARRRTRSNGPGLFFFFFSFVSFFSFLLSVVFSQVIRGNANPGSPRKQATNRTTQPATHTRAGNPTADVFRQAISSSLVCVFLGRRSFARLKPQQAEVPRAR